MSDDRRCGTCRWCDTEGVEFEYGLPGTGKCRRACPDGKAPRAGGRAYWPLVSVGRDWCGEWAATPAAVDLVTGTLSSVTARSLTAQAAAAPNPYDLPRPCSLCGEPVVPWRPLAATGKAVGGEVFHPWCYAGHGTPPDTPQPTEP